MSSAILYLAIVAIWACVLIPRWLRRDSARGAAAPQTSAPAAPPAPFTHAAQAIGVTADYTDAYAGDDAAEDADHAPHPAPAPAVEPTSEADARRRMLAARRRLLLMLIGLEIAAVTLAVIRLAAIWVVIPPSVMLVGYLLLLREAAQADAERAQHEAEAAAYARERARARQAAAPAEGTSTAAAAALAARLAAAPVAADYADRGPGRDFAPGLAGKYTTSYADAETADEDNYDSYEAPRLRAVGD